MRRKWEIVPEMNLDVGPATEWRLMFVKGSFYWIETMSDETFNIIAPDGHTVLMNCKSLASAKRWAHSHIHLRKE